ncbi:putative CRISPR-associated protein [Meiothermus sp. CFH 77666]|uniref:putative CRISPR-associated protein n=1 Tax=Meiothermus sp. CFH 77666 TaxID=2817942 RepID=UPI001AA01D36|nr:putative CRISPR-associated protein [Meiothermus sp. CFH 77666]MBO1437221.1 putative CRISPR-associated protein [Meiothermus sp. CFH 77666]
MSNVILTTVGTSLLFNARRDNLVQDSDILAYIKQDPIKASAETNSLTRILHKGDEIVLLHSDTVEGARAAELLEQYWRQQGVPCSRVRIPGLAYEAQGFVDYGLKNFVRTLAGEIRKATRAQKDVIINATGGFKAEISYATVLGLVFKVPVCYIHEQFREIVTLPPTPISWDNSLFVWYRDFFDWLSEGEGGVRPKAEVEPRMAPLPEEAQVLLETFELDGKPYMGLSPLGDAYLEAFQTEFEQAQSVPVYFSPKAQATWESLEPAAQERYQKLLQRLRLPNRAANSELKSGGGDALGYPKGHTDERLFYAERDGKLYVFALTRHGPEYERMCREGFSWRDFDPADFTLWEG